MSDQNEEVEGADEVTFEYRPSKDNKTYVLRVSSTIAMTYEDFLHAVDCYARDEEERIRRFRAGVEGH